MLRFGAECVLQAVHVALKWQQVDIDGIHSSSTTALREDRSHNGWFLAVARPPASLGGRNWMESGTTPFREILNEPDDPSPNQFQMRAFMSSSLKSLAEEFLLE